MVKPAVVYRFTDGGLFWSLSEQTSFLITEASAGCVLSWLEQPGMDGAATITRISSAR